MNFERKVVETLKDDNGNEVKKGDYVVYSTAGRPNITMVAEFYGIEKGYFLFVGLGVKGSEKEVGYTVQPKTITSLFKCNVDDMFIF